MKLEDYFEFDDCDRIRVKGTRIAIEYLLEHFNEGWSAEQILENYEPILTLEQVYAAITYYLHNEAAVDAYMERAEKHEEATYQEHLTKGRSETVKRLQALRANKT
jgi:uncharacterized protein (DUF433 family)